MTYSEWRSCKSKRRYNSRGEANTARRSLLRKGDQTRAYKCPICGGWHITSQPKLEKAR